MQNACIILAVCYDVGVELFAPPKPRPMPGQHGNRLIVFPTHGAITMQSLALYTDAELAAIRTESARVRGRIIAAHSPYNPMPMSVRELVRKLWSITDRIDAELIARR